MKISRSKWRNTAKKFDLNYTEMGVYAPIFVEIGTHINKSKKVPENLTGVPTNVPVCGVIFVG